MATTTAFRHQLRTEAVWDVGVCQMCERAPAEHYGLVCFQCLDAVDRAEPWTLAYEEVLFRLRELEEELEYR